MPVYRDDTTTPGVDEGAQPGDTISFKINGYPAAPLGPDTPVWTSNGALKQVNLAALTSVTLHIKLNSSWNLMSFNVTPLISDVATVLTTVNGLYSVVLGYDRGGLSYYPILPPEMNTLKTMDPKHGYWIKMGQVATLTIAGVPVSATMPLSMNTSWNLVGYLPNASLPVTAALASINGLYSVVLGYDQGALSYYPILPPQMNTLKTMDPRHGYWIRMTGPGTLVYPAGSLASQGSASRVGATSGVTPTNEWVNFYSQNTTLNGQPVPAGAVIGAYDPQGVKCGEFAVSDVGWYGVMPVYRDDPDTPGDEGALPGDTISFRINGIPAATLGPDAAIWTGNGDLKQVNLRAPGVSIYLPLVLKAFGGP
jgi:uncharacterized Zn-binding protein involved in type VI secretion